MSRDDFETGETLLNPYIEIGKGKESNPNAHINVSTFGNCLGHIIPAFTDNGPVSTDGYRHYCVYGAVGRTVKAGGGRAYVNIYEPPISRTLMGFLSEEVLKRNLPKVHRALNS